MRLERACFAALTMASFAILNEIARDGVLQLVQHLSLLGVPAELADARKAQRRGRHRLDGVVVDVGRDP